MRSATSLTPIDELERHLADDRVEDALRVALTCWRATRDDALAELIEALSARIDPGPAPSEREWCERARRYEEIDAGRLLAHLASPRRADPAEAQWRRDAATQPPPWVAQVPNLPAARLYWLARWPPDPRVATAILGWCEQLVGSWTSRAWWGNTRTEPGPYRDLFALVAAALRASVDDRARPRMLELATRPPGRSGLARAAQLEIANAGLAALAQPDRTHPLTTGERARARAITARLGAPALPAPPRYPRHDPDALWQAVIDAPADDLPRQILADALLERGDPRGELIGWQLANRPDRRADTLIKRHWATWLGEPLTRLAMRGGTRFVRGMIDTLQIGPGSTPPWIYAEVRGHRELGVVRAVRIHRVSPPDYARFVGALRHVRDLAVDTEDVARALVDEGVLAAITGIYVPRLYDAALLAIVARVAAAAPALARVELVRAPDDADLAALAELARTVPLAQVVVPAIADRATRARVAALGNVTIG